MADGTAGVGVTTTGAGGTKRGGLRRVVLARLGRGLCGGLAGHALLLALPVLLLPNVGTADDLLRLALLAGAFMLVDAAGRRAAPMLGRGAPLKVLPGPLVALGAAVFLRPDLAALIAGLVLLTVLRWTVPARLAALTPLPIAAAAMLRLDLALIALGLDPEPPLVLLGGLIALVAALGGTRSRSSGSARHDPPDRFSRRRRWFDAVFGASTLLGIGLYLALVTSAPALTPTGPLAGLNAVLAILAFARHWQAAQRLGPARRHPLHDPWFGALLLAWGLSAGFAFETGTLMRRM